MVWGTVRGAALVCVLLAVRAEAGEAGVRGSGGRPGISRIVRAALPAVVSVTTRQEPTATSQGGGEDEQNGLGAGFIIRPSGYILTSAHVIEGASEITVSVLSSHGQVRDYPARVVGADAQSDCALLKIDAGRRLPVLKLGSSRTVEVADWVVTIGNPFGLAHSVSVGVISYKGRADVVPRGRSTYSDYLQTDAAINPGSSGGPLLDMNGEVVGIANAVNVSGQGIGFAIPIDMAKAVLPQLLTRGSVRRGWMGALVQDLTPDDSRQAGVKRGAVISEVISGSPAARAGLSAGDVILEVNRAPVDRAQDLRWKVAAAGAGGKVALRVLRRGEALRLRLRLESPPAIEQPPEEIVAGAPAMLEIGAAVADLEATLPGSGGLPAPGARVHRVQPDSAAARAGLCPGDVVLGINGSELGTSADLVRSLEQAPRGTPVRLTVRRGGQTLELTFRKP